MRRPVFDTVLGLVVLAVAWGLASPILAEGVTVERLRCEYLENPVGIDVLAPRLSWIVESDTRGQKQTAYRIVVATSEATLAKDQGDLWDSGKVAGNQTLQVAYAGTPLPTKMRCFWKVQAWDKEGKPSAWSRVASWSMGLLTSADWQPAQWIAAPVEPSQGPPTASHHGYHSAWEESAEVTKWVAVDLGQPRTIDAVRLFPARPAEAAHCAPGFLYPVRFKIETAERADWSDAKVVVDRTAADEPHPGIETPIYRFPPTEAHYVKLTVTRLGHGNGSNYGFALAEMQVLAAEQNVALGAGVTASDSIETDGWSTSRLTDGRLVPEGGALQSPNDAATMFRKEFEIGGKVQRATASVTGLGLYELTINGQRVGDHLLAPEWTRYGKRIQYQTYDVTDLLRGGTNVVGAQVAGGWWTGPLLGQLPSPDAQACLLLRLDIEEADGGHQTIVTDPSWLTTRNGPIRKTGIYFGEVYDATQEMPGWDQPGFAAKDWLPAQLLPYPHGSEQAILSAQGNEPIRVIRELRPVKITEPTPGVYVFDLGQNMAGWCRLKANAPAGTKIAVRYAEVLNDNGTLYTVNLRTAAQVNQYTWRGGEASLEPHFTFHGFRYVEVTGLPSPPGEDTLVARVLCSDAADTGTFSSSSELINKILRCAEWTQRSNMEGVPTDCPQRDEREGWMGDIQVFSQTAMFQRDMAAFFTKWVRDIRDSQAEDGRYPDVAPHMADPNTSFSGVPGWGDAGTIIPWRMYQNYADTRMLEQQLDSAVRWVEFIRAQNPDLLWRKSRGGDYGDWLNGDAPLPLEGYPRGQSAVPKEVFATAYFAHSTENVAKMAGILKRTEEAAKYARLFEEIKAAFNKAYVSPDGRIQGDTQAGYALALYFNLLEESSRAKATEHLLEAIQKFRGHPSTGIQTTSRMMLELTRNGRHDEAWRLINLRTMPSWGHMVDMGATTIWECWDSYVKGRGYQEPVTNSLNHWAFGAVGEWVWRHVAGINPDEEHPAYQHFTIRPRPCPGLAWVRSEYDSIRGRIVSNWKQDEEQFTLHVEVPANTTATVYVPAKEAAAVTEGGQALPQAEGVTLLTVAEGCAVLDVASGKYRFRVQAAR